MIWGAIVGAATGFVFYIFRRGGVIFAGDMQRGLHIAVIQAILHAVTPAVIGALIGWAVA